MTTKQTEWQAKAVADAPMTCRNILSRAYAGEAAPRQAIKAFCLRCVGYVRADVSDCTAWACPLHPYRPYQTGSTGAEASVPASQDASAGSS
jgi:hypothetical protein